MAKVKATNGRLQFDVLDLMRASMGFERPDGYAVLPQDVARQVQDEFERLYAIEDEATSLVDLVDGGAFVNPQGLERLRLLTGRAGIGQ